jgi:mono/diheme cytochrome c family protein
MHEIKKSLTLFACAALPLLAWATPQETTIRGDVPVPHSASPAKPELSAGAKIFDKWCSDCHSTTEGPGSLALQRKYQGALPAVLEQRGGLTPDYIRLAVRHGISFMPSFRKTEISDADLALLAAYLVRPQ